MARLGIGIESAGQMLITVGDNPDRIGSEAGFAMLCGVAPLPVSSGRPDGIGSTAAGTDEPTGLCT